MMSLPTSFLPHRVPLQPVLDAAYAAKGVELWVLRDDLIHPQISGNKYRKLKYTVAAALAQGAPQLITFGGAYSNHLLATAAAGRAVGLPTVGVVRGEQPPRLGATLLACKAMGMQLHYVSRTEYRQRDDKDFQAALLARVGEGYLIPEGGTTTLALQGVAEVWENIGEPCDWMVTAVGTGGTLAGLALGAPAATQVLGIVALKGYEGTMEAEIADLLAQAGSTAHGWRLEHQAHHGGYAKATPALLHFIRAWPRQHGFLLDPVYTGKVFYYLHHRIVAGYFPRGTRIVALHTGGLQGIAGFNERHQAQLPTAVDG